MAEIKIHLHYNLETGKKDIVIEYETEDDAMPYEHEERHWQIVEELIGKGVLDPNDVGQLRVGTKDKQPTPVAGQQNQAPQAEKSGSGN